MSILTQANKLNQQMIKKEEEEKMALINGSNISGGSKKINESSKINEDEFTSLLNKYALTKSRYDQSYKTLTPDQIKKYKDDFKQQEETLTKNYNLLKNKKSKYYCSNYIIELCNKQDRQKLTNNNLGKILFKYYKENSNCSKDEINKKVSNMVNFIEKERIKNEITINKLIDTVKNNTLSKNDNICITSKKHNIGLYKINKFSLSCYDDKRHILEDGITSYAHGHKNVKEFIKPLK